MSKEYQEEIKRRFAGHEITNDGRVVKIRLSRMTRADHHRGAKYAEEEHLTKAELLELLFR